MRTFVTVDEMNDAGVLAQKFADQCGNVPLEVMLIAALCLVKHVAAYAENDTDAMYISGQLRNCAQQINSGIMTGRQV